MGDAGDVCDASEMGLKDAGIMIDASVDVQPFAAEANRAATETASLYICMHRDQTSMMMGHLYLVLGCDDVVSWSLSPGSSTTPLLSLTAPSPRSGRPETPVRARHSPPELAH